MGSSQKINCAECDYGLEVRFGVGMMYSPNAVFYGGKKPNPAQTWSIAFPDGYCERGVPLLTSLVEDKRIREEALRLLEDGAVHDEDYGHTLYACPKCGNLENLFYFELIPSSVISENKDILEKQALLRYLAGYDLAGYVGSSPIPDAKKYKPDYHCSQCDAVLLPAFVENNSLFASDTQKKIDWKCPACGSESIAEDKSHRSFWD